MWHDKSNVLFVNYQAKLKKSVCLLSTMHSAPDVDTGSPKRKPCVILFYNQNKVGVDCFDQMTRLYTTRSASRRWPLAVWGNILDIAAINEKVLFVKSDGKHISRRQFIFQLIKNLCNEPNRQFHFLMLFLLHTLLANEGSAMVKAATMQPLICV